MTHDLRLDEPVRERALGRGLPHARHRLAAGRVGAVRRAARQPRPRRRCSARTRRSPATSSPLAFPGKSGQDWDSEIRDADLAAVVRSLKPRGGRARLLAWRPEAGSPWRPLHASEINEYVKLRAGDEFTREGLPHPARHGRRRGQPGAGPARRPPSAAGAGRRRAGDARRGRRARQHPVASPARRTSTPGSSTPTSTARRSTRPAWARRRPRCGRCSSADPGRGALPPRRSRAGGP